MSNYKLFYITCKNKKEAEKIASSLVKKNLSACVNILPGVKSYFKWNKKINIAKEIVLIGKTTSKNMNKINIHVKKIHSYDCPCIVFVSLQNGNKDFLRWIKSSVQ
jgi:periplasmic divalent cation tolerance protein